MKTIKLFELTTESTLSEALQAYAASPFITNRLARSPRAAEPYHYLTTAHAEFCSIKLCDITRARVAGWRDDLTERGYAQGTIDGMLSKLRRLGDRLVDYDLLRTNLFRVVGNAAPAAPKRQTRVLSSDEISALEGYLYDCNPVYAAAFRLCLQTAMRLGEVVNILPEHVKADKLYIPRSLDKTGRERTVHLNAAALSILVPLLAKRQDGPLFPVKPGTLRMALRRASLALGIPAFWHLTRHSAISYAAAHTQSLAELKAFSGHSTLLALQGYLHLDSQTMDEAVRKSIPARLC